MDEWVNFYNTPSPSTHINTAPKPLLSMLQSNSAMYANIEDIVTYYLNIKNNSNTPLENITIKDLLPNNLRFINGSVQIDDISMPQDSVISGISIEKLKPTQELNVSFDVEALSIGSVKNQISATYEYLKSQNAPPSIGLDYSNPSNLNIYSATLKVTKTSDKSVVSLNDIIEYSIKVHNTGNLDTFNVLFKDDLPKYLTLIPGSFTINNYVINSVDLESGINIGSIPIGKYINIKYKVKVISNPCNYQIINKASTSYLYKLPDGTVGKGSSQFSNDTNTVNMRTSNFKQFSICEYLQIPNEKPDIEDINNVSGEIDIVRSHIITTPQIQSLEGQILSGYKMIIHGILKVVVEYTACEVLQSVHSAHYSIPFSTFVVLPINFTPGSKVSIHPLIEDIYSKSVSCNTLFIDATSMINIKILSC